MTAQHGLGILVQDEARRAPHFAAGASVYELIRRGAPAPLTEVARRAHARRKPRMSTSIRNRVLRRGRSKGSPDCLRLSRVQRRPPAERVAARRAKATPILAELRAFLDKTMAKISGKSSLAGATATPYRAGWL